jgi:adenylate cyclase
LSRAGEQSVGAVIFTDIVGFTEFTAVRGDADALALLDVQSSLVRGALPADGRIVKDLGDGLMLWMPNAPLALTMCIELLEEFAAATRRGTPLWVRMGMHWGRPTRRGDDLVGHDVNLASRIADAAGPGELLVSADAVDAAADALRTLNCEELGPVVMRGIPDPVRLFRVSSPVRVVDP